MARLFGLADCNNFYCSCERVFRPDLRELPVVVLSNNDGCVIARSEESKRLGLKMGDPLFKVRKILDDNNVAVFSSNYTLYGSLSNRVMSILSRYTSQLDQYSIDEAFLDLSDMGDGTFLKAYSEDMVREVRRSVGIPISVGIAPTKTLAKIASKYAKKFRGYRGCCLIDTEEKRRKALEGFEAADVWGIGRQVNKSLERHGIHTAADFANKSESWVRNHFNVTVLRTWKELNGTSCIDIEELPQKKSICTSRSFADQGITDLNVLEEAVANFASRCSAKLREQRSCCRSVTVFAYTSRFRSDVPSHTINQSLTMPVAVQSSAEIIGAALHMLRTCFRPGAGYAYKKAGVILWNICSERTVQQYLFDTVDRQKQLSLVKAIDNINRINGRDKVRVAVQGSDIRFGLKHEYMSRHYTTDVNDLIIAKI